MSLLCVAVAVGVAVVGVVVCVRCGVVWCGVVWCGMVTHAEKLPCVRSQRPRVYRHQSHICKHMRTCCQCKQERFDRTHGHVLNGHTAWGREGHRQFCLPKFAHKGSSHAPDIHRKNHRMLPMFKFENRSRTTCPRFLQSFALPDEAVQLQTHDTTTHTHAHTHNETQQHTRTQHRTTQHRKRHTEEKKR